jgi:hypothetical protein
VLLKEDFRVRIFAKQDTSTPVIKTVRFRQLPGMSRFPVTGRKSLGSKVSVEVAIRNPNKQLPRPDVPRSFIRIPPSSQLSIAAPG